MPEARPLLRADILRAMAHTRSNKAAARYLGCGYTHYKRFAKLFKTDDGDKTLFASHMNRGGKGIPKFLVGNKHEPAIIELLEGRIDPSHFSPEKIKLKIIHESLLAECCNRCGFGERRVVDYKVPLLLSFKDNNKKNYLLPNLELLCYNCYFLYVGDTFSEKQVEQIEDFKPHNMSEGEEEVNWEFDDHQIANMKALGIL